MFDHLLESSHRDDSNKWSNIGFHEEITQVESIEFNCMHLIWCSDQRVKAVQGVLQATDGHCKLKQHFF